jgi:integral membrane sensor domain MASE1
MYSCGSVTAVQFCNCLVYHSHSLDAMITVSPSVTHLIAWQCQPSFKKPWKLTECFVLILICIGLLLLIFLFTIQTFVRPLPYFFFPLIMYMGFRFNRVGWALTVSSITYVCSWSSIRRRGSIYTMTGRPYPAASQLILQVPAATSSSPESFGFLWFA